MAKWTQEELLCNARGLDDGYLFIHSSFPLAQKVKAVLQNGKTAKAPKTRLTDAASHGCAGFSGSLRPPLSNGIYPLDEDTVVKAPSASSKVEFSSHDNLFTEPIHSNDSICVAFTEPLKLSHKSILLPGAVPPPVKLNNEDRRIRRPRLNRGGGTIANMGTSNGQSRKSGYGSMNIDSHERDAAQRTGRGNQMHQAGTRAWGAMEPTPKRPYQPSNPFHAQANGGAPPPPPQNRPPWQQHQNQQHQNSGYRPPHQQRPPPYQQQQQGRHQPPGNPQFQQNYNQRYQQKPFVTAKPEVCEYDIGKDDWFLILSSDGVWDVMDNEEAAHVIIASSCVMEDGQLKIDTNRFKWAARNLCEHAR
jgi:hypothetical protein